MNQVVDHPPLGPHEEIEIAQAHVEIDDGDAIAAPRQSRTERGSRCRLADAPLSGRHHQHVGHFHVPLLQSIVVISSASLSSQAWMHASRRCASIWSATT